jgi:hypothetical protein
MSASYEEIHSSFEVGLEFLPTCDIDMTEAEQEKLEQKLLRRFDYLPNFRLKVNLKKLVD